MAFIVEKSRLQRAIAWFKDKINKLRGKDKTGKDVDLKKTKSFDQVVKKLMPGLIYSHVYDAKWKESLPFWDAVPLWALINIAPDRMLGFNFHYIPPQQRLIFLEEYQKHIMLKASQNGIKDPKEIPIEKMSKWGGEYLGSVYQMSIKSPGNILRACVRTYLYTNIRSRITPIIFDEWDNIANLILPNFQKQTAANIYDEIERIYKKYKGNSYKDII